MVLNDDKMQEAVKITTVLTGESIMDNCKCNFKGKHWWFTCCLTKKYAMEIDFDMRDWLNRNFPSKENPYGWTVFSCAAWLHYDGKRNDHAPSLTAWLDVLGIHLEIDVYNRYHAGKGPGRLKVYNQ